MTGSGDRSPLLGFLLGVVAATAYVQWGGWGMIPLVNLAEPTAPWARVVFWPGVRVGHWSYAELYRPVFGFEVAKNLAGGTGILVMGLVGALVAAALASLLRATPNR